MPQLRLALAQVDTRVGDFAGNADWCATGRRAAAEAGRPSRRLPRDDADRLPGGGPRAARVVRRRAREPRSRSWPPSWPTTGSASCRRRRLPRPRRGAGRRPAGGGLGTGTPRTAAPATRRGCPQQRRRRAARRRGRRPLRQAPPAELRRLRRGPLLRAGRRARRWCASHGVDVALADLRGPLAGGRPGRGDPGRPASTCWSCLNASPYERDKDDLRLAAGAPPRRRGRAHDRLPQPGRRPGRAGLRRRLDGGRRRRRGAGPRAAVRRAPAHRRPDPSPPTVDQDGRPTAGSGRMTVTRHVLRRAGRAVRAAAAARRRAARRLRGGLARRWSRACGDYMRQERLPSVVLGMSGGIDSALVAALAADAIGGRRVVGVSMPSEVLQRALARTTPQDLAEPHRRCTTASQPIAPMVDAYHEVGRADRRRGGEPAGPGARHAADGAVEPATGHLVLATGNKSELAVGYSTLYGDAVGGFAPIKDVPKTLVWELARWRNAEARARGEIAADPAELDRQAAVGGAAPGPARPGLAARRTRCSTPCSSGYVDARPGPRRAARARASTRRSSTGWSRWSTGRSGSAGSPRRARRSAEGVRPRPAAADHQPLARGQA